MKRLLDWHSFNRYQQFADTELILERQDEDINSKKARIKTSYAFQILTGRYRFFAELAYNLKSSILGIQKLKRLPLMELTCSLIQISLRH